MSSANVTTCLIAASSVESGREVQELLHKTGKSLLVVDVVADATCLSMALDNYKPDVLVADDNLNLDPRDYGVPVVRFGPFPIDVEDLSNQIVRREGEMPSASSPVPERTISRGVAIGFQGIKGGVGTTTVAAGMAAAAAGCGYRTAVLDLAGDCALTLRAQPDQKDGNLYLTENGILVVQDSKDLGQTWQILQSEYDVVVVDAGRVGENVPEARALVRLGVLFFLVITTGEIEMLNPGSYPGYRLFLNRQPNRRWWQLCVAGGVPDDPEVTERVNRGTFGASSPFLLEMQQFTTRVVQREII
jgi:hypothetical protein